MLTLKDVKGVGDATIKKLHDLGINNVFEVFSFLPRKYVDLQSPIKVLDAPVGQLSLFEGRVEKVSQVSMRSKKSFYVTFSDELDDNRIFFKATFYNMPFLHDTFETGQRYRLLARLSKDVGVLSVVNPSLEKIEKISKLDGIYTVYPLRGVFGQNAYKNIVYSALDTLKNVKYDDSALSKVSKDLATCFELAHRPDNVQTAERAVNALSSIDIAIMLSIYRKLRDNSQKSRNVFYNFSNFRIVDFEKALGFAPTITQTQAFEDIMQDLTSPFNMSRIVSGDVGSGKTAVAFFAMYLCSFAHKQCALMAPTEILAKQHAEKFSKIANALGINFVLLTSSTTSSERRRILSRLKDGSVDCIIGTNSIVSDDVEYKNLSLAIIDEQHRFGVNDRAKLEKKGACDVLSLTATPIPRSMALTFYDDIAISRIEKRESAKTNVKTTVVSDIDDALKRIVDSLQNGKQAFIVCPSIVDAEGNDLMSIESFMRDYGGYFDGFACSVMHGKLSNDEKEAAMRDFSIGKTRLLVATTVIEVGIDTKASEILILNADRFGLASLHQLRGRVGRDGSPANCILYSSNKGEKAIERLSTLEKSNDGQYLAEVDFSMRGAGDFIGTKQSGISVTPIFGLQMNGEVLKNAKSYADGLSNLSLNELLALTHCSRSKVDDFIEKIEKVTINS